MAAAALKQRLLFFKIPYLDGKRGTSRNCVRGLGRSVIELMTVAGRSHRPKTPAFRNLLAPSL